MSKEGMMDIIIDADDFECNCDCHSPQNIMQERSVDTLSNEGFIPSPAPEDKPLKQELEDIRETMMKLSPGVRGKVIFVIDRLSELNAKAVAHLKAFLLSEYKFTKSAFNEIDNIFGDFSGDNAKEKDNE